MKWVSFDEWNFLKEWRRKQESELNPFRYEITEEEYLRRQSEKHNN